MFVVTGGGSGIGKALAKALAARDKKVLIIGRREELLADVAELSPKISYLTADVSTNIGRDLISIYLKSLNKISKVTAWIINRRNGKEIKSSIIINWWI